MEQKIIDGFPLFLHMQHQLITMMFLFLRLSKFKILPNAAGQTKKVTLKGVLFLQMLFQEKVRLAGETKRMIKRSNFECLPFERDLTDPILATSTQPNRVQEIEE
jgi:hypothetical protein